MSGRCTWSPFRQPLDRHLAGEQNRLALPALREELPLRRPPDHLAHAQPLAALRAPIPVLPPQTLYTLTASFQGDVFIVIEEHHISSPLIC
jgi:hypothetical protein